MDDYIWVMRTKSCSLPEKWIQQFYKLLSLGLVQILMDYVRENYNNVRELSGKCHGISTAVVRGNHAPVIFDNVEKVSSCLTLGRISTSSVMSVWINDINCSYIITYPVSNLAHEVIGSKFIIHSLHQQSSNLESIPWVLFHQQTVVLVDLMIFFW